MSDKIALKLFNTTQNITGKTIEWNRGEFTGSYIVSGVFQSPPANATDQFDLIFNYKIYATKEAEDIAYWGSNGQYTYLLLKKGTDIDAFNKKIKDFTRDKIKQFYPEINTCCIGKGIFSLKNILSDTCIITMSMAK